MADDSGDERWFPEDWRHTVNHGTGSCTHSVAAFQQPDYTKFPSEKLRDHDFFERLLLSMRDLSQASSAAVFLRREVDWEERYKLEELRRFQAYETSLVVSYVRPFSKSDGSIPPLSYGRLGIRLSNYARSIHEDLIHKRNKIFAHSDASAIEFAPPFILSGKREDDSTYTSLGPPQFLEGVLFERSEFARVEAMIDCLFFAVFAMAQAMHPNFIDRYPVHEQQMAGQLR